MFIKNIVCIFQDPPTKDNQKRFCINELISSGFNLEYWNMSQYFYPGMVWVDEVIESYCFKINSLEALKNKLNNIVIKDYVFFIKVRDIWKNRKFHKILKIFNCYTIWIKPYVVLDFLNRNKKEKIFDFLIMKNKEKIKMIINYLYNKLYQIYCKVNNIHYNVEMSPRPKFKKGVKSIIINSFDYEQDLLNKTQVSLVDFKYAVFLDQYFPLHPELIHYHNMKYSEKDAKVYLNIMCNFFNMIEKQFEIKVIIAAHPKSEYTEFDFGNRHIYKYVTNQLVQHAEFTISHGSGSLSFAAIWHNPLILCYTNEYKDKEKEGYRKIKWYKKYFKAPLINIEESINSKSYLPTPYIDIKACDNYKYNYLTKPEIEKKTNKEIIIQYLDQL
jgi:hypothetical protein